MYNYNRSFKYQLLSTILQSLGIAKAVLSWTPGLRRKSRASTEVGKGGAARRRGGRSTCCLLINKYGDVLNKSGVLTNKWRFKRQTSCFQKQTW